jgi:NAD(P)H-dependent FMN reductase
MSIKVVALTGSLRKASVNAGLLRAAAALAPKHDMEFAILSSDLPLFNEDLEVAGVAGDVHAIAAWHAFSNTAY